MCRQNKKKKKRKSEAGSRGTNGVMMDGKRKGAEMQTGGSRFK